MVRLNRILLFISSLAVVIIAAEIYYLSSLGRTQKQEPVSPPSTNKISSKPSPSSKRETECLLAKLPDQAIDSSLLWSLGQMKKGILTSSVITNELKGTLAELNTEGGVHRGFKWTLRFEIKNDAGLSNFVGLDAQSVEKMKVYDRTGGKDKAVSYKDLKNGDKIMVYETIDLLKNIDGSQGDNLVELKIVRLQ
jgi:hypothetical protein